MLHEGMEHRRKRGHKMKGQKKVGVVMREYYKGKLHSGSDSGPVVTNPAQAKAIAMSEAGLSRRKRRRRGKKA